MKAAGYEISGHLLRASVTPERYQGEKAFRCLGLVDGNARRGMLKQQLHLVYFDFFIYIMVDLELSVMRLFLEEESGDDFTYKIAERKSA